MFSYILFKRCNGLKTLNGFWTSSPAWVTAPTGPRRRMTPETRTWTRVSSSGTATTGKITRRSSFSIKYRYTIGGTVQRLLEFTENCHQSFFCSYSTLNTLLTQTLIRFFYCFQLKLKVFLSSLFYNQLG